MSPLTARLAGIGEMPADQLGHVIVYITCAESR